MSLVDVPYASTATFVDSRGLSLPDSQSVGHAIIKACRALFWLSMAAFFVGVVVVFTDPLSKWPPSFYRAYTFFDSGYTHKCAGPITDGACVAVKVFRDSNDERRFERVLPLGQQY